jgi:hypothetical protein
MIEVHQEAGTGIVEAITVAPYAMIATADD